MLINLESRFAPAYRIKIGGYHPTIEKTSEGGRKWRPPVKYDYFKVCHNSRDDITGNFEPALEIMKAYMVGDEETPADAKPKSLNIVLFSNQISDVFDQWRALYMSRKCSCRTVDLFMTHDLETFGDPVAALNHAADYPSYPEVVQLARWDKTQYRVPAKFEITNETSEYAYVKCPERLCDYTIDGRCKVNSVLRCMIVEAPELGAVAEFRTTSVYSAMQLKKSLEMVQQMTSGRMAGLELNLRLEPKTVEKGTVHVAHIVYPHGGLLDLKKAAAEISVEGAEYDRQILIAEASVVNFEETPEEAAHIEAEFYEKDDKGEIVVEAPTEDADETTKGEPPEVEESPEERAGNGPDDLPFEHPETSDEVVELERHPECEFPETAKVDPSYCESECKHSNRCEKFKGAVPWESPDEDDEGSPAEDKTFNLFQ